MNSVTLTNDADGRKHLSNFLFQCFDALKVYGKEPEQMKNLNAMFQMVLADYSFDQIRAAFTFYLKHNSELPAPADIANIIERGIKPQFKESVYVQIAKKPGCERSQDEWQYMREYEHFQLTGTHKALPKRKVVNLAAPILDGFKEINDYQYLTPDGKTIPIEVYHKILGAVQNGESLPSFYDCE